MTELKNRNELQGRPLRGINFGPGPAWSDRKNIKNKNYKWTPAKGNIWQKIFKISKNKKRKTRKKRGFRSNIVINISFTIYKMGVKDIQEKILKKKKKN